MATAKLDIKRVINAVDTRNFNFYDNLPDDEKKLFNPYILMRTTSNVNGGRDIQEWFVETTNEHVNKNYSVLSKNHPGLLWKLYASTGVGKTMYHQYLANGKKGKANKIEKLLAEIYPAWKLEDIKILASMMTDSDKNELFDSMGLDKAQRKEYE
jgi:hypothetical protein